MTASGPTCDTRTGSTAMNDHASGPSRAQPRMRAKARVSVRSSHAVPYDDSACPALMELHLSETFAGDIEGESPVRALQVLCDDESASLVSMQRFSGTLCGRHGTFVL